MSQEREKTRERGCGESAFGIKEMEEIGRQPEAATVQDTHTRKHVSDGDVLLCISTVSHGVRNALL